jgi:hypothetical protein
LFFAPVYILPALVAVAIGILAGLRLSMACPRLDGFKRRAVVILVAVVANSMWIGLLLGGLLDFGVGFVVFELPAYSVANAIAALITTSASLAFS